MQVGGVAAGNVHHAGPEVGIALQQGKLLGNAELGQQLLGPALNQLLISLWWRRHGLFPSGIKTRKPGARAPGFC